MLGATGKEPGSQAQSESGPGGRRHRDKGDTREQARAARGGVRRAARRVTQGAASDRPDHSQVGASWDEVRRAARAALPLPRAARAATPARIKGQWRPWWRAGWVRCRPAGGGAVIKAAGSGLKGRSRRCHLLPHLTHTAALCTFQCFFFLLYLGGWGTMAPIYQS